MTNEITIPPIAKARVLVVDDEKSVCSALARSLTLLGYNADFAISGQEALDMLSCTVYNVVVLDIHMPEVDGIEVMERASQMQPDLKVILLTGRASLESAIAAVRAQAADYLLKPVSVYGLAAAIEHALQRDQGGVPQLPSQERFLRVGPVTLDRERNEVCIVGVGDVGNLEVRLTASETVLLEQLMQHPNKVLSCRNLSMNALGYDVSEAEARGIVRPHICRLRKKLDPDQERPFLIRTVPGRGYLFGLMYSE